MNTCFSNATVSWDEREILRREAFIREIPVIILNAWRRLNSQVQLERCETPILTPESYLRGHLGGDFELLSAGKRGYLRPETTAGTYEEFRKKWVNPAHMKKYLPYCMWQAGISFREEANSDTLRASKLRLAQFWQLEFQLFASHGTKAPYLTAAMDALIAVYGGYWVVVTDKPHYSTHTVDWEIDCVEVASLSERQDWEHGIVFEVAIGLDRLVALCNNPITL